MGEIADGMLDGTLCIECGVYLGAEGPTRCASCREDVAEDRSAACYWAKKFPCPVQGCTHRFKTEQGAIDHQRMVHTKRTS